MGGAAWATGSAGDAHSADQQRLWLLGRLVPVPDDELVPAAQDA